jgi:hypothetical protein
LFSISFLLCPNYFPPFLFFILLCSRVYLLCIRQKKMLEGDSPDGEDLPPASSLFSSIGESRGVGGAKKAVIRYRIPKDSKTPR